ncbi:MAG: hypothetical protein ACKO1N_02295 [Erythrobacter sp.]
MCLRISSALVGLTLLAGCEGEVSQAPVGEKVACAIGEATVLAANCTLERSADGTAMVINHPDGGFRRLTRDPATGTMVSGDGADILLPQPGEGDAIAFAIGPDRYSIPRSLLDPAAQPAPAQ